MNNPSRDDLVWWAVGASVPIPSRYRIGPDRCARVLIVLALHANVDGHAWPSADTIASTIPGLHRRDVRDALAVLEAGGFISRIEEPHVKRRSVTWLLHGSAAAPDLAGTPATPASDDLAGIPATQDRPEVAGDLAGDVAGDVAGDLAGIPATNRREGKRTPLANAREDAPSATPWAGEEECDVRRPRGAHELNAAGIACAHCNAPNPTLTRAERETLATSWAFEELRRERAITIGVDTLMRHAQRLGAGDLTTGARIVRQVLDRPAPPDTRDLDALLRSRLDTAGARRVQAA